MVLHIMTGCQNEDKPHSQRNLSSLNTPNRNAKKKKSFIEVTRDTASSANCSGEFPRTSSERKFVRENEEGIISQEGVGLKKFIFISK